MELGALLELCEVVIADGAIAEIDCSDASCVFAWCQLLVTKAIFFAVETDTVKTVFAGPAIEEKVGIRTVLAVFAVLQIVASKQVSAVVAKFAIDAPGAVNDVAAVAEEMGELAIPAVNDPDAEITIFAAGGPIAILNAFARLRHDTSSLARDSYGQFAELVEERAIEIVWLAELERLPFLGLKRFGIVYLHLALG